MSGALKYEFISEKEYLNAELHSEIKHEYREGLVYAMSGGTTGHSQVATNGVVSLGARLRGKPCRPFNSDLKVRIPIPGDLRFYYPDLSVLCQPNDQNSHFNEEPKLVMEVLSPSTRRTDLSEKKDAYLLIPTLDVYLLAEADQPEVIVWRRQADRSFEAERYLGLDAVIPLTEIDTELPLAELYDGLSFSE